MSVDTIQPIGDATGQFPTADLLEQTNTFPVVDGEPSEVNEMAAVIDAIYEDSSPEEIATGWEDHIDSKRLDNFGGLGDDSVPADADFHLTPDATGDRRLEVDRYSRLREKRPRVYRFGQVLGVISRPKSVLADTENYLQAGSEPSPEFVIVETPVDSSEVTPSYTVAPQDSATLEHTGGMKIDARWIADLEEDASRVPEGTLSVEGVPKDIEADRLASKFRGIGKRALSAARSIFSRKKGEATTETDVTFSVDNGDHNSTKVSDKPLSRKQLIENRNQYRKDARAINSATNYNPYDIVDLAGEILDNTTDVYRRHKAGMRIGLAAVAAVTLLPAGVLIFKSSKGDSAGNSDVPATAEPSPDSSASESTNIRDAESADPYSVHMDVEYGLTHVVRENLRNRGADVESISPEQLVEFVGNNIDVDNPGNFFQRVTFEEQLEAPSISWSAMHHEWRINDPEGRTVTLDPRVADEAAEAYNSGALGGDGSVGENGVYNPVFAN
ncbi:hypothetical protein KBC31_01710 [Candidatus Saccharibacteria bacterium]|jgi:hypothetical protein|nr:hypothetical protein [Candidatus Saccharibacteria bacterium]